MPRPSGFGGPVDGVSCARCVHGIATTGRIITGAARIIVVAFTQFAAGLKSVTFQRMGFEVGGSPAR